MHVYDIIYVMLGVNNLSIRGSDKKVTPRYDDVGTLIEMMTTKYEIFKYQLQPLSKNVVSCQLIGLNLHLYNKDQNMFVAEQKVINEAMPLLAHTINLINEESHLISQWLTKIVHYRVNHKQYNAYGKLSDGPHFHPSTSMIVAKRMNEAIYKFLSISM